jgi:hypothetical protein
MSIDALIALGVAVAGLIAFAIAMGRREKAAIRAMGVADHFQVKGFEAHIDRARREVHIMVEGREGPFCAPFGHLVVEYKVETVTLAHEKRPRRRCRIALTSTRRRLLATGRPVASRDWAETVWTAVETGKTWVRLRAVRLPAYYAQHWDAQDEGRTQVQTDIRDVSLPNGSAKAFKLWVDHHGRQLFPDVAAVRAKWDQECAELLRACRQQRDHYANAAGALETWSFSSEPTIAYFVIEANGAAFWAAGNTPMLEPIDRPRSKLAEDKLIISSGDEHRSFPIPTSRIATLQALQRLGVAQMA